MSVFLPCLHMTSMNRKQVDHYTRPSKLSMNRVLAKTVNYLKLFDISHAPSSCLVLQGILRNKIAGYIICNKELGSPKEITRKFQ